MASHIDTFAKGRLRLERNYIDLFLGPRLLAEGYDDLKGNSVKVNFDDLIKDTDTILKSIFDYLELEHDHTIVNKFSKIKLEGQYGDKKGYDKYDHIESNTIEKWKVVFASRYRKKIAKKYVLKISSENLLTFGHNQAMLIKQIEDLKIRKSGHFYDRLDMIISHIFRVFEIPLFARKTKLYLLNKKQWYVHR
jgi:hypothetical protein